MNSLKLYKRVIGIALSVLFVNVALADANSDARIQAYKANKLIPQNVVLSTSTGAADFDEVVVFNKSTLSWKSDNASSVFYAPLLEKYGDMTIDELRAAIGPSGTYDANAYVWTEDGWLKDVTPEQQEIREYLSLVANNKLQSDAITSSEALAYLQEQFDLIINVSGLEGALPNVGAFPCEGLDFSNRCFLYADFSSYTGITAEQILSANSLEYTILPSIAFTGNESFEGKDLNNTDLRKCTGIRGEQIMSASNIRGAYLPAIAFTGNESFGSKDLSNTDFSNCTGITATQIGSTCAIAFMRITTAQYNEWKSTLQSKFKNTYVYVDGVRTKIQ